jgi:hypothetical protein
MIFILGAALIYYFLIYARYLNPDLTSSLIRTDSYTPINLGKSDFFISFVYREDGELKIIEDFQLTWFRVAAY